MKILIRFLSIVAIVILTAVQIGKILDLFSPGKNEINWIFWSTLIANFLAIVIFICVAIFPSKYGLIAFMCLCYTLIIFSEREENPMGIMMFNLALIILTVRGFFKKYGKIKAISLLCILVILLCFRLQFGLNFFVDNTISDIAYSLVFFMAIFFTYKYASRNAPDEKILNIAKYEGLKESDIDLMYRVLNNLQYKVIAKELQKSEGTIRNRLNKIYDILGVADRVGFVTTFSGFELIYKPEIEVPETQVAENPDNF